MGQKKLFIVSVETEIAVVAEDRYEAEEIARFRLEEEASQSDACMFFAMEVKEEKQLDRQWGEAIPWSGSFSNDPFDPQNPDKTCLEILKDILGRNAVHEQPKIEGLG